MAAFGEWLSSESWNMFEDSSEDAIRLVAAINIRVDSYEAGMLDAARLRAELSGLLNNVLVSQPFEISADQQRYLEFVKMEKLLPQMGAHPVAA